MNMETEVDNSNIDITIKKRGRKTKIVKKNGDAVVIAVPIEEEVVNVNEVKVKVNEVKVKVNEVKVKVNEVKVNVNEVKVNVNEVKVNVNEVDENEVDEKESKLPKKRGRKPKGGKIILNSFLNESVAIQEPNIILHLKCGQADIVQNTFLSSLTSDYNAPCVETFQFEQNKGNELNYQHINPQHQNNNNNNNIHQDHNKPIDELKIIWDKLKELTYNLHTNNISDKKSACFWCTCEFDNPSIFIPKFELNNMYQCYGCFCSPECATAFLFKESIDTSTRFERYHLLNHIYCKIYDYKKNIKPAPDPFYTLNKYYGNLSIQEYRRLLKNERLLLVVDKPLSRTLPELHEDNDEFIYNGKTIPSSNKFKLRRKNKQSKTDILSDTFNLKATPTF